MKAQRLVLALMVLSFGGLTTDVSFAQSSLKRQDNKETSGPALTFEAQQQNHNRAGSSLQIKQDIEELSEQQGSPIKSLPDWYTFSYKRPAGMTSWDITINLVGNELTIVAKFNLGGSVHTRVVDLRTGKASHNGIEVPRYDHNKDGSRDRSYNEAYVKLIKTMNVQLKDALPHAQRGRDRNKISKILGRAKLFLPNNLPPARKD